MEASTAPVAPDPPIVTRLVEALDQAETLVRQTTWALRHDCSMCQEPDPALTWRYDGGDCVVFDCRSHDHEVFTGAGYGMTWLNKEIGEWVAAWDPGMVLRLIDRDRRLAKGLAEAERVRRNRGDGYTTGRVCELTIAVEAALDFWLPTSAEVPTRRGFRGDEDHGLPLGARATIDTVEPSGGLL